MMYLKGIKRRLDRMARQAGPCLACAGRPTLAPAGSEEAEPCPGCGWAPATWETLTVASREELAAVLAVPLAGGVERLATVRPGRC